MKSWIVGIVLFGFGIGFIGVGTWLTEGIEEVPWAIFGFIALASIGFAIYFIIKTVYKKYRKTNT